MGKTLYVDLAGSFIKEDNSYTKCDLHPVVY